MQEIFRKRLCIYPKKREGVQDQKAKSKRQLKRKWREKERFKAPLDEEEGVSTN